MGGEMDILGVVTYTGRDPDSHKYSGLFSSSKTIAKWIQEGNKEVLQVVDLLNLVLKYACLHLIDCMDDASNYSIGRAL